MTTLDDASAIHILKTIARARLAGDREPAPTPELRQTLAVAFDTGSLTPASEGDLARAALALLAEDPQFAEPIQTTSQNPRATERFTDPATIGLITAAVLALQTRAKFKRDNTGKWSVEVEKKSSGDGPLKLLVERLLSYLPH